MSLPRRAARELLITTISPDGMHSRPDVVAGEEPLEIRIAGPGQSPMSVAVTMRTPGDDFELAVGFLHAEGLLGGARVHQVRYCTEGADQQYNIVTVDVARRVDTGELTRRFAATAACGLCGKATLDDVALRCDPVPAGEPVAASVLHEVAAHLAAAQPIFAATGGLHAAGLYTGAGEALVVREDIGRHNAVDKCVGARLLAGDGRVPAVLAVSGRLGYEIVQKAVASAIPVVAGVSAPSTLAVETARRFGVTLVGFLRGDTANVYAHPERLLV